MSLTLSTPVIEISLHGVIDRHFSYATVVHVSGRMSYYYYITIKS